MGGKKKKLSVRKPDLEEFLPHEKRRYVTYEVGAQKYGVEKWTFAKWAKNAGATASWKRWIVVDLDILDEYLKRENVTSPKRRKRNGKTEKRN